MYNENVKFLKDIAVDGWALTLLSPNNVSYGSTCQSIGIIYLI